MQLQKDQCSIFSDNSQFSKTFLRNRESLSELLVRKLTQKYANPDSRQYLLAPTRQDSSIKTLEPVEEEVEVKLTPELVSLFIKQIVADFFTNQKVTDQAIRDLDLKVTQELSGREFRAFARQQQQALATIPDDANEGEDPNESPPVVAGEEPLPSVLSRDDRISGVTQKRSQCMTSAF